MKGWWPQVRAALIALHVVAVVVGAAPAPEGGLKRSSWREATVQGELDAWHHRIMRVAPTLGREAFEDHLWNLATGWSEVRALALVPFRPYYRAVGTEQSWRMFVAPHRYPARLWIELQDERDGDWRPLYVTRSRDYRWRGEMLDSERFRAALFRYSWRHFVRSYEQLGGWLADRAALEFPDAYALRTRWYRYRTPSPDEVMEHREPEGAFERTRLFVLAPRRTGATP